MHCFKYGTRKPLPETPKICTQVYYYPRRKGFSPTLPYIVFSRKNEELHRRLLEDDAPVLLEGIHCSWPVLDKRFSRKKMAVRLFNIEFDYYKGLAKYTRSWLKKWYYRSESRLLRKYEAKIAKNAVVLALSASDSSYYQQIFGAQNTHFLPVMFYGSAEILPGTGDYCLYHGNLSVEENEEAALGLIRNVFPGLGIPLVIAGKNPSAQLIRAVNNLPGASVIANPTELKMNQLVSCAQINVLPALNSTGVKLKILYALFHGRHCITNTAGVTGLPQTGLISVAETAESLKKWITEHYPVPFTQEMIQERTRLLKQHFDAGKQAEQLMSYLY